MPDTRRKRIAKVMLALYGVLGGALAFYLFLTPGIALDSFQENGQLFLVVKNDSSHAIENISVQTEKQGTQTTIAHIQRLEARQAQFISIQPAYGYSNRFEFVAQAPFHASQKKVIETHTGEAQPQASVELKLSIPETINAFNAFDLNAQLCNPTPELILMQFKETHAPSFFAENDFTATLALNAQECTTQTIHLTPLQTGATQILFNINVEDTTSSYQQEITVEP